MRQDVKQTQAWKSCICMNRYSSGHTSSFNNWSTYCDALTRIITLACSLTLQSFITRHIVHQWIRNWILDRHQHCTNAEEKQLQNMNRNTVWIKFHIISPPENISIYLPAEECVPQTLLHAQNGFDIVSVQQVQKCPLRTGISFNTHIFSHTSRLRGMHYAKEYHFWQKQF